MLAIQLERDRPAPREASNVRGAEADALDYAGETVRIVGEGEVIG